MSEQQKRDILKKAYPDKKWAEKVDKMPDSQVTTMLQRLKQQNKI